MHALKIPVTTSERQLSEAEDVSGFPISQTWVLERQATAAETEKSLILWWECGGKE